MSLHLHPEFVIPKLVEQHATSFAWVHGGLQVAVPESYALLSGRHPNHDAHGLVVSAVVRQTLLDIGIPTDGGSLEMSCGKGLSVVLKDGAGTVMRVRKWPSDRFTGERLRPVELMVEPTLDDEDALFSEVETQAPYEVFVLWTPHVESGTLDQVVLAAMTNPDDPSKVQIYVTVDLPAAVIRQAAAPAPQPVDDFDEEIGEDEGLGEV